MESYKHLKIKLKELEGKIELAKRAEISEVIVEIRKKIGDYELAPRDIFPFLGAEQYKVMRRRPAPKYMNPKTGATWSGRGRPPNWILEAENREELLLDRELTLTQN